MAESGQARVMADLLQRCQDCLVCVLRAAGVLLAGVDVITKVFTVTELVNDVPNSSADKRRRLTVAWLAWPAAVLLTTCSLPQLRNRHTGRATMSCRLGLTSRP